MGLKRLSHLLAEMYPQSFIKRVVDMGYHNMVQAGRHERLGRDPTCTRIKPREALHSLILVERAEFSYVLSETDFLTSTAQFYYGGTPTTHIQHWTQPKYPTFLHLRVAS